MVGEPDSLIDIDDEDLFDPITLQAAENAKYDQQQVADERVVRLIQVRKGAYSRVFTAGATASQADIDLVLVDLAHFCRGYTSEYKTDSRDHALLSGRREVFLRIMEHKVIGFEDLLIKYTSALTRG